MRPPAALTARADSMTCSCVSTEHGPAMIAKWPPPTLTPRTSTTVSFGWNSRLTSLYGLRIATTRSTPGMASRGSAVSSSRSPMTPMTVTRSPLETWADAPTSSTRATT